jgi:hypothetical protein
VDADEIEARLGIQKTMASYQLYVDTGKAAGIASLFTEECEYHLGPGNICRSRAAIVEGVEATKSTFFSAPAEFGRIRHHVSSISIDLLEPGKAKAASYFLAIANWGPDHWGSYRDQLVEVDGSWLFAVRRSIVHGSRPDSPVAHLVEG